LGFLLVGTTANSQVERGKGEGKQTGGGGISEDNGKSKWGLISGCGGRDDQKLMP